MSWAVLTTSYCKDNVRFLFSQCFLILSIFSCVHSLVDVLYIQTDHCKYHKGPHTFWFSNEILSFVIRNILQFSIGNEDCVFSKLQKCHWWSLWHYARIHVRRFSPKNNVTSKYHEKDERRNTETCREQRKATKWIDRSRHVPYRHRQKSSVVRIRGAVRQWVGSETVRVRQWQSDSWSQSVWVRLSQFGVGAEVCASLKSGAEYESAVLGWEYAVIRTAGPTAKAWGHSPSTTQLFCIVLYSFHLKLLDITLLRVTSLNSFWVYKLSVFHSRRWSQSISFSNPASEFLW